MKTLSITVQESLLKEFDRGIREADLPGRSEGVRQAMREWLKKQALLKMICREVQGYRKRPVKKDEFGPLISSQEFQE